ncbi:hypothetical protein FC52_GL000836 [Lactobacillus pasteurii DSM 23907 = CRBIP 24.76]|uniref:Uncharacterized protein n=1 Tax=Lactobacillus pasteurii DSM 23907 = CRBIP 24.76 TaxID=1423790 RepID=I7JXV7_9LACO|nr:hypothetical protein [Lactobacillus pasteurii]KRK07287.1 hypothetical protein FC52_GL000836 [Lactobacillus pasteurii DSM 23907 = CRBIP 24.76]TDG78397.1 hypothetical protein C5L33_000995 [Lactobacillus pasteurii]CCI84980.1 Protein of unknown function [Lactobacillus pasteurii DSM 23907 = CRBIP 24.76]
MFSKKTVLTFVGSALLCVGASTYLSTTVKADTIEVAPKTETITLNPKSFSPEASNNNALLDQKVYARNLWDIDGGAPAGDGPRIWGSGYKWHWWGAVH